MTCVVLELWITFDYTVSAGPARRRTASKDSTLSLQPDFSKFCIVMFVTHNAALGVVLTCTAAIAQRSGKQYE